MAAHVPSVVWSLRAPEYGAYVTTHDEDSIGLTLVDTDHRVGRVAVVISRKDARLLVKRINACLDATAAKGKYGRRAGAS